MTSLIRYLALQLVVSIVFLVPSDGKGVKMQNPFRSNKPFKRLERFLKSATYSRELGDNLKLIGEYLADSEKANDPDNMPLTKAAEEFSKMANFLEVFKASSAKRNLCNLQNTKILTNLREQIERDFNDKVTSNDIRLRRVVQLHRDTVLPYVSLCFALSTKEWSQFSVEKELFGTSGDDEKREANAALAFALFLSEMRDWTSTTAYGYKGFRLPLKEVLHESKRSPEQLYDAPTWPAVQALDQFLAAQHELNSDELDSLRQLVPMEGGEQKVINLLDETLFKPCQILVGANGDGNEATKMLAEAPDLIKLLPDFDLLQEGAQEDRLLEWSRRQLICRRLVEQTNSDQLAERVLNWVEMHN